MLKFSQANCWFDRLELLCSIELDVWRFAEWQTNTTLNNKAWCSKHTNSFLHQQNLTELTVDTLEHQHCQTHNINQTKLTNCNQTSKALNQLRGTFGMFGKLWNLGIFGRKSVSNWIFEPSYNQLVESCNEMKIWWYTRHVMQSPKIDWIGYGILWCQY